MCAIFLCIKLQRSSLHVACESDGVVRLDMSYRTPQVNIPNMCCNRLSFTTVLQVELGTLVSVLHTALCGSAVMLWYAYLG